MPLADLNAVCNLAMDHLGEPYFTDYLTDTTVAAAAARLHLPQCVETVLESHVWSFATRCQQLTTAPVDQTTASALIGTGNAAILLTANTTGPAGNDITILVSDTTPSGDLVTVDGNAITVFINKAVMTISGTLSPDMNGALYYVNHVNGKPFYSSTGEPYSTTGADFSDIADGIYLYSCRELVRKVAGEVDGVWISNTPGATPDLSTDWGADGSETGTITVTASNAIAQQIVDAINAHSGASALVTAALANGSDGTGSMVAVSTTNLSGGSSTATVYAPAWGSAFNLPSDCLRVLKLDGADIDIPQDRWEILGRHLLLADELAEAPVIHYISKDAPVDEWPTTFTDAVAFLLAARLAPKLAQDDNLATALLQKHELALGKAKVKDARETRSAENFGPRQLAARSGLVRARYGSTLPPY
jgi:hypothetical protein